MAWYKSPYWRTVRRWFAVFVGGGISALLAFWAELPPEQQVWFIPILTSILMAADKGLREKWK